MAIAPFQTYTITPANALTAGRQAYLALLNTAMLHAGFTLVDTVMVSATEDYQVWSYPLKPTGTQFLRVACNASSANFSIQVSMFEGWDAVAHAGTNQSFLSTFSMSAAGGGSAVIRLESAGSADLPHVNVFLNNAFHHRVGFNAPTGISDDWIGPNVMLLHPTDISGLSAYPSVTNGGNSPIGNTYTMALLAGGLLDGPSSRTGRIKNLPGFVLLWQGTENETFGPCNEDVALAPASNLAPLGTITPDGVWRSVWTSSAQGSVMIRVA